MRSRDAHLLTYSLLMLPAVVVEQSCNTDGFGPERLKLSPQPLWLLRAELTRFGSGRSTGAICPFLDIYPKVDRETQYFF